MREHFNLPGRDLADFNFLPFEKVRSGDHFVVEARESYWIRKYGVFGEGGMNRRSSEINTKEMVEFHRQISFVNIAMAILRH